MWIGLTATQHGVAHKGFFSSGRLGNCSGVTLVFLVAGSSVEGGISYISSAPVATARGPLQY